MLTPRRVSASVTSRTMPGRSAPTRSQRDQSVSLGAGAAGTLCEWSPCRPAVSRPLSAPARPRRSSSGTATSTMPANSPARRAAALEPGPPSERRPLRDRVDQPRPSRPTKVSTSGVVMSVSLPARVARALQNEPAQIGVFGEVADMRSRRRRRRSSRVSPERSGAVKLISSSTRSITVCSRRAPMFSTLVDRRRCRPARRSRRR